MPKNPESFISSYKNEPEIIREIPEYLIGAEVNLYYHGQNIPVILESINNSYGHATVVLKKRTVLADGRVWEKDARVIVSNREITRDPIKKSRLVRAPKEVQYISTKF